MIRGLSAHVDTTLSRAREAIALDKYRVVEVRPDGVIVSKRIFGRDVVRYFATDTRIGAP